MAAVLEQFADLTPAQRVERYYTAVTAELCRRSLRKFVYSVWPLIDPAPFTPGWHIDAICDHLAYVHLGDIKNLMINVPPRSSKPVSCYARVLERQRGWVELNSIVEGEEVLTHRGRFRRVLAVHEQGVLPLVEIETRSGRKLRCTPDHPVLTTRGWIESAELRPGDVVAQVIPQADCGTDTVTKEEARLIGYLLGDGSCNGTQPGVTNASSEVLDDVARCAAAIGFTTRRRVKAGCSSAFQILNSNDLRKWMDRHELRGKSSYTKRIPQSLLSANAETIAHALAAYWCCDGFISKKGTSRDGSLRPDICVGCDSVSRELLEGIQHLLLRLGIESRLRTKRAKLQSRRQGGIYTSYCLLLSSQDAVARFAERVAPYMVHEKRHQLGALTRTRFDRVLAEDEVVALRAIGEGECRCLTVDEDSSFAANDIAVHNSSVVSVAFPAWVWCDQPEEQFLCASYAADLAKLDAAKMRRLVESEWYQSRYPDVILIPDENRIDRFSNTRGGYRTTISVGSKTTGLGGNYQILDDPHNAEEVEHEAARKKVINWHDNAWRSRRNDPNKARRIYVGQRTHAMDLFAHVLEKEEKRWVVLKLPMEYDASKKCITYINRGSGPIGEPIFQDPRTKPGSLLCPARYSEETIEAEKEATPQRVWMAQFQQDPEGAGGKIWKKKWWRKWEWPKWHPEYRKSERPLPEFIEIIQAYDTAFEEDEQDSFTVRTTWGVFLYAEMVQGDRGRIGYGKERTNCILLERKKWRPGFGEMRDEAIESFEEWREAGVEPDRILIEKKASGHSLIQELRRKRLPVRAVKVQGDLVYRAHMASLPLEKGAVWYIDRPWAASFIDTCAKFPDVDFDDEVSSAAIALQYMRKHMDLELEDDEDNEDDLALFDPKLVRRSSFYG